MICVLYYKYTVWNVLAKTDFLKLFGHFFFFFKNKKLIKKKKKKGKKGKKHSLDACF